MSDPEAQATTVIVEQEFPLKKYFNTFKKLFAFIKNFNFKAFFQGIFTFISVIAAYLIVEFTYEHSNYVQKVTNLKLKKISTIPLLFLYLSLYLIFWNIVAYFLKRKALTPTVVLDQYDQIPEVEDVGPPSLAPLPNGQLYTHEIIYDSLHKTVYYSLLLLSISTYAYLNQPKRSDLPALVTIEKLCLLGVWFFLANILDMLGRLLQKVTKMQQFRVLGISIGFLVGALVLGLTYGLNTFIFI